jgi:hypothetical protein
VILAIKEKCEHHQTRSAQKFTLLALGPAWTLLGSRKTRIEENAFPFRVDFQLVGDLPLTLLFIGGRFHITHDSLT